LLWLVDAALQAQPFMFTRGFATQVIASNGQGQPGFVAGPGHWASNVIAAHPLAWNIPSVAIQLLIGIGLLMRRSVRPALAVSIAWALGVWYFGEGLSGLASGNASLLTGAPGSALLYAVLAAAAWPRSSPSGESTARWLRFAWAALWVGGAVLEALPSQSSGHGPLAVTFLAEAQALIGIGVLARPTRTAAVTAGLALALAFWVLGQHAGGIDTGRATDPNTGPVIALMAVALLAGRDRRRRSSGRTRLLPACGAVVRSIRPRSLTQEF
jgi:hypothetical protein